MLPETCKVACMCCATTYSSEYSKCVYFCGVKRQGTDTLPDTGKSIDTILRSIFLDSLLPVPSHRMRVKCDSSETNKGSNHSLAREGLIGEVKGVVKFVRENNTCLQNRSSMAAPLPLPVMTTRLGVCHSGWTGGCMNWDRVYSKSIVDRL